MFCQPVDNKIELLGHVIADLKDMELAISIVNDPALIMEYEIERKALIQELNEVSERCVVLIEAYMQDCKEQNIPPYLNYYRVLRELRRSII
jgi:hypothetical protein